MISIDRSNGSTFLTKVQQWFPRTLIPLRPDIDQNSTGHSRLPGCFSRPAPDPISGVESPYRMTSNVPGKHYPLDMGLDDLDYY